MQLLIPYIADIIGLFFALPVLFRLFGVDYYNPLVQQIRRLTEPLLAPLRLLLPVVWRLDLAALGTLTLISAAPMLWVYGFPGFELIGWAAIDAGHMLLNLLMYTVFLLVIMSWVAPDASHPAAAVVKQIATPMLAPFRRLVSGLPLDLSPIFALIGIAMCRYLLSELAVILHMPLGWS